jgi:hypothetical protein
MPKIKNEVLAGQALWALDALITLDAEGLAEVTAAQAEYLAQVPGYTVVPDAPKPAAKTSKKSAPADKE